jgi:hypothetical protein
MKAFRVSLYRRVERLKSSWVFAVICPSRVDFNALAASRRRVLLDRMTAQAAEDGLYDALGDLGAGGSR